MKKQILNIFRKKLIKWVYINFFIFKDIFKVVYIKVIKVYKYFKIKSYWSIASIFIDFILIVSLRSLINFIS